MVRCFRMTPAFFLYVETTQACLKNRLGRFAPSALPHYKHTLPRLARSSLNELQQKQHEKASLVFMRVQSPSQLALVPCALSMVDLSGQWCWIRHGYRKVLFLFLYFWHPMLVRPAMKRLFCVKAKNGLGRFAPSTMWFSGSSLICHVWRFHLVVE